MLTILGEMDLAGGFPRRSFLRVGGLAGGLSLVGGSFPKALDARTETRGTSAHKAVINVILPGGPPHLDMFDLKPDAPREIRGEFQPIPTKVPGISICELLPRLAAIMDKLVIVRSLCGGLEDHNVHQCLTGWESHPQQGDSRKIAGYPEGGWPSLGAVVSKLQGPVNSATPSFVSLSPKNAESVTRASLNQAGFLGLSHEGFEPTRRRRTDAFYETGASREAIERNREEDADIILRGISLERLADRQSLLESLDNFRRDVDAKGTLAGLDTTTQQAFGILTSGEFAEALDLDREDPSVRDRYGIKAARVPVKGGPKLLEQFLLARRLVEAGARCVTLAFSAWPMERESRGGYNWDFHNYGFDRARMFFPLLDIGLSALIEDLDARGMLDDVSIVAWGEFGRTPKINNRAGRDHWPAVGNCLLAGGGMRGGQVIGSTDPHGMAPKDRPVHFREVFATLYHNIGIDARHVSLTDRSGRPQFICDRGPIDEVL